MKQGVKLIIGTIGIENKWFLVKLFVRLIL